MRGWTHAGATIVWVYLILMEVRNTANLHISLLMHRLRLLPAAEEAAHMMNNLDFQGAVKEVGEAAQYLKETG
jgi:predicted oxidoreductase